MEQILYHWYLFSTWYISVVYFTFFIFYDYIKHQTSFIFFYHITGLSYYPNEWYLEVIAMPLDSIMSLVPNQSYKEIEKGFSLVMVKINRFKLFYFYFLWLVKVVGRRGVLEPKLPSEFQDYIVCLIGGGFNCSPIQLHNKSPRS